MYLLFYVDDMCLTGNNDAIIKHLLDSLAKEFMMKDLGPLHYFLGVQAHFHRDGLFLSQEKYGTDLLINAGMKDCAPMPTPLPLQLDKLEDIQFSVNYVCQKMHEPTISDFQLLKRILRYIKGTVRMGINLSSNSASNLTAFSDSDYAGCKDTICSTCGFCTFLGTNIISWSAKRHPTVSKSSTEAEYRTMSEVASEIKWISSLLRDLGVAQPHTPEIFCGNLSAIYLSTNSSLHSRSKHFDTDFHYVRERVALGTLVVTFLHTPSSQMCLPSHCLNNLFLLFVPNLVFAYHPTQVCGGV
ncbi:PREDICTED: uncharacterized protein LOC109132480 [Camelina sativa]|uniref:Uncharacterized protein LOC109132480 n=1 Tax=Camelina sativa TaxID=90675 RepID=A0ABM1RKW1_CAMSA|nr:PREDICTED: uncharacterized protein LOC109132480 [Camelina sativa]